jgi:protein-S-isoprenylcysteine O-methyltransferase Ste14
MRALLGSLAFFVVAPGAVAGGLPYWLTRWRVEPPFLGLAALRVVGGLLVCAGLASVVESFVRFALVGIGTPAPVAPTRHLVVSGQYRHVRNPMYVAVVATIVGQALVFGSVELLQYAAVVWLAFHAFVRLYEEPALAAQFGAPYDEYRRHVRRWWPRLRPWGVS